MTEPTIIEESPAAASQHNDTPIHFFDFFDDREVESGLVQQYCDSLGISVGSTPGLISE
ncbi:hypothetical protein IIB50_02255 [Patescibacteria group bacterium]|nr:hypothetical protein [Patescibacteria group bacterium]